LVGRYIGILGNRSVILYYFTAKPVKMYWIGFTAEWVWEMPKH